MNDQSIKTYVTFGDISAGDIFTCVTPTSSNKVRSILLKMDGPIGSVYLNHPNRGKTCFIRNDALVKKLSPDEIFKRI